MPLHCRKEYLILPVYDLLTTHPPSDPAKTSMGHKIRQQFRQTSINNYKVSTLSIYIRRLNMNSLLLYSIQTFNLIIEKLY